jgi:hypothetical protein
LFGIKIVAIPSVDIRYEFVLDFLAVLFPIFSILASASGIISANSVDEKHGKDNYIEVGNDVGEATGHAPGGSKENVTYIVEVS